MCWTSDGYKDTIRYWQTGNKDLDILLKGVGEVSEQVCLDFGCGIGRLTIHAKEAFRKVHGIDISKTVIDITKNNESDSLDT